MALGVTPGGAVLLALSFMIAPDHLRDRPSEPAIRFSAPDTLPSYLAVPDHRALSSANSGQQAGWKHL